LKDFSNECWFLFCFLLVSSLFFLCHGTPNPYEPVVSSFYSKHNFVPGGSLIRISHGPPTSNCTYGFKKEQKNKHLWSWTPFFWLSSVGNFVRGGFGFEELFEKENLADGDDHDEDPVPHAPTVYHG
jgi:hypothetical protein